MMQICLSCKETYPLDRFRDYRYQGKIFPGSKCDPCMGDYRSRLNRQRRDNPEYRLAERVKRYGITPEQHNNQLAAQNGCCPICEEALEKSVIDHDHSCCEVSNGYTCGECNRGLLCSRCNILLGMSKDRLDILKNALSYLESRGCWVSEKTSNSLYEK